jgi:hypothetical protein
MISVDVGTRYRDSAVVNGGADADAISLRGLRSATVDAGTGDDRVTVDIRGGGYTVTLGSGADTLTLGAVAGFGAGTGAPVSQIVVTDFQPGPGGDIFDLPAFLSGSALPGHAIGSDPFDGGYVRLIQAGSDVLFEVDRGGGGDGFTTLMTFRNVAVGAFRAANLGGVDPLATLYGSFDDDVLVGGGARDALYGMGGNDGLNGGDGADRLFGDTGLDRLFGGGGNDQIEGGAGDDAVDGGDGIDTARFGGGLSSSLVGFQASGAVSVSGPEGRDLLTGIELARFADGTIDLAAAAPVGALYVATGGRDASAGELAFWTAEIGAGRATLASIKATILADPLGQANTARSVSAFYEEYLGRDPVATELAFWDGQVVAGLDFAQVRAIIVADPSSRAFVAGRVAMLYDEYLGRAPDGGEIAFWSNEVRIGTDFAGVRAALVNDPSGQAYLPTAIDTIYRDYGGRGVTGDELTFWTGELRAGSSLDDVRNAVLDDGLGRGFTTAALSGLYTELFGREASASDQAVWRGLFGEGFTLDTARSTLTFDVGSAGRVGRLAGTAGADEFVFETGDRHVAVSGFDPFADRIDLRALGLTGVDPLDAAHAREVRTLDGGTDVLILLGEGRDLILRGVALGQLGAEDFLL